MPSSLVEDAIAHYDELLATRFQPDTWWREHAAEIKRHWFDEAPLGAFVLRPRMLDEANYLETCASLAPVARALAIAAERLATDEALRRTLGIPDYLEPLLAIDAAHGQPPCLGRLDGIPTRDGRVVIIEFNSEPKSVPFQYEVERAFDRLAITQAFGERYRVRTVDLYDNVHRALRTGGPREVSAVAVVDKAVWQSPRRASTFRPLMYAAARGTPVVFVDPEELDYRGGELRASGIRVDMVAFVDWELLINSRKRLVKVLKAIADGAVGVFAGLSRGLLASYKVVFELLSSAAYRDMFPPDVHEALSRHVPWTRLLRERTTDRGGATVDLLPFVADHRDGLVIKPSGGGGGGNVTIGRDVDTATWSAAIHRGVTQNWIVQDLAVPARESFPVADASGRIAYHELACELTPYVWNGSRIEGILSRVVAGPVMFDFGDRPIGLDNGIETATWIISRRAPA
ncbi:MAG: hypothetical protein JWO36_5456 [Myxococcales bacterium]|nr:hypothetical protein [Myxococcales bacterium]